MTYAPQKLRADIIRPVLKQLRLYSPAAENLLFGTCAHESKMGKYRKQVGGGPALGIYQMEPATYKSIWNDYLIYRPELAKLVLEFSGHPCTPSADAMILNDKYATAMARIKYLSIPAELPAADDLEGLANYWKKYYNTPLGKGTPESFIKDYEKYGKETS